MLSNKNLKTSSLTYASCIRVSVFIFVNSCSLFSVFVFFIVVSLHVAINFDVMRKFALLQAIKEIYESSLYLEITFALRLKYVCICGEFLKILLLMIFFYMAEALSTKTVLLILCTTHWTNSRLE